jgi:single-stranded-DNA-specific exonuclease
MGVELLPQSTRVLKDRHLKMSLRQGDSVFPAIGFNMAERFYTESLPRTLDVAYTPQLNSFRGDTVVQLVLRDIRPAE